MHTAPEGISQPLSEQQLPGLPLAGVALEVSHGCALQRAKLSRALDEHEVPPLGMSVKPGLQRGLHVLEGPRTAMQLPAVAFPGTGGTPHDASQVAEMNFPARQTDVPVTIVLPRHAGMHVCPWAIAPLQLPIPPSMGGIRTCAAVQPFGTQTACESTPFSHLVTFWPPSSR
jgi:hypothetical protein